MAKRGRKSKPDKLVKFHIVLCLHPVADADIINSLEESPNKGKLVREWIRYGRQAQSLSSAEEEKPDLSELAIEF